ncbi:adenylate/guanylate cyclase domain-containing protein [Mesorhizobium sp. M00.F.Ca.ET.216.01.1.1]|nr:adenylate/guanylate cyclase domain-containing protein [Mesorhizobium sp. M00.F.Ca.ET.216.01.1.1]
MARSLWLWRILSADGQKLFAYLHFRFVPTGAPASDLRSSQLNPSALAARIAELELEVGRQEVQHQQLVVAKGRLDRELQRFQAIQRYVQRAVLVRDLEGLHILTLEGIVEAFEFEIALFLRWDGNLSVAQAFGFDDPPSAAALPFEKGWIEDGASRILKQDDPVLKAWSALGLREAIIAPVADKDGELSGILVGGRTLVRGELYDEVSAEQRSSFEVLVGQAEALFHNFTLAAEIRERNQRLQSLTRSYSRFVPFEFLELLGRDSIEAVSPADHIRLDMTILFADLRGFTNTSESLGAEKAFVLLNEYLQVMEPEISARHGFISQYQGDGFVALFHRGADSAIAAATGICRALANLNKIRAARDEAALRIGIGINSGELMLGAIGGEQRLNGNVVGDAVNLASRVEGLTKLYGAVCVLTDATVRRLSHSACSFLRELDRVVVVGRTTPVTIYELMDLDPPALRGGKLDAAKEFQRGLGLYRDGVFAAAVDAFTRCLKVCPNDHAATLYVKRCCELMQSPQVSGWQGITVLDRK